MSFYRSPIRHSLSLYCLSTLDDESEGTPLERLHRSPISIAGHLHPHTYQNLLHAHVSIPVLRGRQLLKNQASARGGVSAKPIGDNETTKQRTPFNKADTSDQATNVLKRLSRLVLSKSTIDQPMDPTQMLVQNTSYQPPPAHCAYLHPPMSDQHKKWTSMIKTLMIYVLV